MPEARSGSGSSGRPAKPPALDQGSGSPSAGAHGSAESRRATDPRPGTNDVPMGVALSPQGR